MYKTLNPAWEKIYEMWVNLHWSPNIENRERHILRLFYSACLVSEYMCINTSALFLSMSNIVNNAMPLNCAFFQGMLQFYQPADVREE